MDILREPNQASAVIVTPVKPVRMAFYVSGDCNLIDTARLNASGEYVGHYSDENLTQLRERHPNAELISFEDAVKAIQSAQHAAYVKPASETTEDRYMDALECLFPEDWRGTPFHNGVGFESFKMCEYTCGSITAIYAKFGRRYFYLSDYGYLSHYDILAKVGEAFPELREG